MCSEYVEVTWRLRENLPIEEKIFIKENEESQTLAAKRERHKSHFQVRELSCCVCFYCFALIYDFRFIAIVTLICVYGDLINLNYDSVADNCHCSFYDALLQLTWFMSIKCPACCIFHKSTSIISLLSLFVHLIYFKKSSFSQSLMIVIYSLSIHIFLLCLIFKFICICCEMHEYSSVFVYCWTFAIEIFFQAKMHLFQFHA